MYCLWLSFGVKCLMQRDLLTSSEACRRAFVMREVPLYRGTSLVWNDVRGFGANVGNGARGFGGIGASVT